MKKLFVCIFILFFLVEIYSSFTWNVIGDDYVYYAMGKKVAEGYYPYKDFFYAHPPLQLILYGFLFKLIHFSHTFRVFFILLTIVNSYLLFLIVKRDFNESTALIASTMVLYAPTMLYNASFEYGLTIAMFFFLCGLKWQKIGLQTIFFLLASFYRFHMVFLIVGYYAYKLIKKEWNYLFWGFLFLGVFLAINDLLIGLVPNYAQDVFFYHIYKPQSNIGTFLTISTILKINWLLFLFPLILVLFYIKELDIQLLKYILILIPFLLVLVKGGVFFGYYFVILIPFLAVIGAYTIKKISHWSVYLILLYFVVISALNYATIEIKKIPNLDIKEYAIIGDSQTISYLSLIKGNQVMGNNIDTNSMLYESGIKNIWELIYNIKFQHPMVIIKKDEGLYARNDNFRNLLKNDCKLKQIEGDYQTYKC